VTKPPAAPKIYHIVHVDKLPYIIADSCLWCDAEIIWRQTEGTTIGMGSIKQRRLSLPVHCHPGTCVGDYVPFYLCPRSVMLYVIHQANHKELSYRGGQEPIVHLEADLHEVVEWAGQEGRRWAFSLANAGAIYTQFRCCLEQLNQVDWNAIVARDWRAPEVKERKQAEFLMHQSFPWKRVSRIGVKSIAIRTRVAEALALAQHKPKIEIKPDWYY
jgi:hypothetical protein